MSSRSQLLDMGICKVLIPLTKSSSIEVQGNSAAALGNLSSKGIASKSISNRRSAIELLLQMVVVTRTTIRLSMRSGTSQMMACMATCTILTSPDATFPAHRPFGLSFNLLDSEGNLIPSIFQN